MLQGLAENRLQQQQAGLAFFQGATQLEAQKLASQQQQMANQLQQNLIVSGQESQMDMLKHMFEAQMGQFGGGVGGMGGPGGRGGYSAGDVRHLWRSIMTPAGRGIRDQFGRTTV